MDRSLIRSSLKPALSQDKRVPSEIEELAYEIFLDAVSGCLIHEGEEFETPHTTDFSEVAGDAFDAAEAFYREANRRKARE